MKPYQSPTGLVAVLAVKPSLDDEPRKPGPEEAHPGSRVAASVLVLATVIVAALDAGRFHWTHPIGKMAQIAALTVLTSAAGLQVWAMAANPFFSTAIRIQRDRGHRVVQHGPYRFIRHPG